MSKNYQTTLNAASEISNIRAWITRRKEIAKDLAFAIDMYNELTSASDYEYQHQTCLLYTSPSPRDRQKSRMPSSA